MKSYLKFLSRNKLYTAIEAVGLAVSLAFVIIIGSYVWQQFAVTRENPDGDRIYLPGMPDSPGLTYGFPGVVTEIPEIEKVARLCPVGLTYKEGEVLYGAGVDRSFFDLFPNHHFVEGSAEVISSLSNVIVSESFARKNDISVGDNIKLGENELNVGAVLEQPDGTVFQYYEVYLPVELYKDSFQAFDNFGSTITFLKVRPGTDRSVLYDKLEALCKRVYPDVYGHNFFERLELFRFDELFFRDTEKLFRHGDLRTIRVLLLVGLLLLLSAIFNYVNLSVALTGKRAKEMAVRQLSGASKERIVIKYIGESILFTAVCFVMGLLLADAFCPMMNTLLSNPDVPIRIVWSPGYLLAYVGIIIVVGAVCGVIPATMAGRYNALDVMKGGFRRKTKMVFSKVFIVIQNVLAIFLIALAITMEAQMRKTQNRPMHCNITDKFNLSFITMEDQTPLKDALERLPFVKRIGKCSGVPGTNPGGQYSTTRDGKDILYRLYRMDSTAFHMFDFEILKDFNAPVFNSVWFSDESFAATGFDDSYQDISVLTQRAAGCDQLAGIFKAFPTNSANIGEEEYAIISVVRPEDIQIGSFLIETSGDRKEAQSKIMEAYEEYAKERDVYLNYPSWVDENIEDAWKPARNNMRLVELFTLLAIIISLLGLLAMSTYYADEKSRDIAVRKVFGGTVNTEVWHTIRDYMALVGIACVIGIPIAVYAAQEYLKDFIYRLDGYWWIFAVAVLLAITIAFASVLWQTLKAARTNPAIELKKE
ncbi:MAG: ABC transporter permease [Bacteroidales bacterium]|nr:ABC transporter permease [Bacteroidales bacterium]